MPSSTPAPGEVPYALDADPRALWPTTSQQLAERVDELTTSYAASGVIVGGWAAPVSGGMIPLAGGAEPGQPWTVEPSGLFHYTGPTRRFLVTLMVTMSQGAPGLVSTAGLGTILGDIDRTSEQSSGPGPDGQATHTHHVSMVLTMGPENSTELFAAASSDGGAAVHARLEVVSL